MSSEGFTHSFMNIHARLHPLYAHLGNHQLCLPIISKLITQKTILAYCIHEDYSANEITMPSLGLTLYEGHPIKNETFSIVQ